MIVVTNSQFVISNDLVKTVHAFRIGAFYVSKYKGFRQNVDLTVLINCNTSLNGIVHGYFHSITNLQYIYECKYHALNLGISLLTSVSILISI